MIWRNAHKLHTPVSMIFSMPFLAKIELTSHISVTQLSCLLPGRLELNLRHQIADSKKGLALIFFSFFKECTSLGEKEILRALSDGYTSSGERGRIKRPVSAGNLLRVEKEGRWEMEAGGEEWRKRRRGWLLCHRKWNVTGFFHPAGEATPAPPQLSRQSGTRATGGNLWRDHSP